ncbi:hypothetical protein D3C75_775510 [compost metagenome]
MAASRALNQVYRVILCFNKNKDRNGTRMTDNPVINPALEVLVYRSPIVWKAYPRNKKKPSRLA